MSGKTLGDLYDYCCLHYSHKVAIVFGEKRFTFSQLKENGTRLTNALLGLGLEKGDRLAMLMPNCPEVLFADYACCKIGLAKIPLATYLNVKDMIFMLQETQARAIIYDSILGHYVEQFKQELPHLEHIICHTLDNTTIPQGEFDIQSLRSDSSFEEVKSKVHENDIATITYTGGTTGVPKGVVHSHRSRVNSILMELLDFEIGYNEVFLAAAPLSHGTGTLVLPVFLRGGCCVILQGFNATRFLEKIEKERCTSSFVVPTMIYALLDHPESKKYDTSSLRNLIYGAAPIAPHRLKEAVRTFGPVFTQIYGQAEAPMALAAFPREEHLIEGDQKALSRMASCGRPTLLTQVRLMDEDGNEVDRGQAGEIVVKSPNIMVEYFNRPDLTAETVKDGWLHTGDIARQDEDGYLYIVDRKKDMVVSGGFNIFPTEIESVLYEHPAVAMAAVIGVPDSKWGEAVKAVVVRKLDQSVSEEDLIKFCKERKGSIAAPKSIDFADSIPLTPLGKPDRKALREQYWRDRDRRVG
jgi:acyl-CoA synthetase (AMP-forming)/AMP-acid ligase II